MTDYDDDDDRDGYAEMAGPDDEDDDGCQLGDRCCCPHPYHSASECFDAEWAESYFAETGEQPTCCDRHEVGRG